MIEKQRKEKKIKRQKGVEKTIEEEEEEHHHLPLVVVQGTAVLLEDMSSQLDSAEVIGE